MVVRQTACRICGTDIEGFSPYPKGEWRDRGGNRTCPGSNTDLVPEGQVHCPVPDTDAVRFVDIEVGEQFEFAYGSSLGFEQGPWIKISARRYQKPGMTCRVGSINVYVRRVLE